LADFAFMDEGDAIASLGFIQIRRGDENGKTIGCEVRQGVPKFYRETGSTPVVGSSSTRTRGSGTKAQTSDNFCFMPPLSCPARRPLNPIHVKHGEILLATFGNLAGRDLSQITAVTDVFRDREIGTQTERLR
jgi:hypothetical protein